MGRWLATFITIPMMVILFVVGLLSTGAGHGTVVIMKLFYAPIYMLRNINLSFPDSFAFSVMLFCGLHLVYSLLADSLRMVSRGIIYFVVLLGVHYVVFFYAIDIEDKIKFNNAYSIDPSFINFAVTLFLAWQAFLIFRILKKTQPLILTSNQ